MTLTEGVRLAIGVVALLAVLHLVLGAAGIRIGRAPVVAVARGAAQIVLVGLALRGVLTAPPAVAVALAVMLGVAVWTAGGRLRGFAATGARPGVAALAACSTGAATTLAVVFALGVLPLDPRYLVALGGIVIGGTMTGTTLAGRHLLAGLRSERETVEGWLALGATAREAVRDVARRAVLETLVPALDQTRTTGLVTLPGAFVGALLGGADPLQAARFQLVVLAGLLTAQGVTAVVLVALLGAPSPLPGDGDG